jgi:hypothetical protein
MAKGQKRSNRENKKPKQTKPKVIAATSLFTTTPARPAPYAPGRKK